MAKSRKPARKAAGAKPAGKRTAKKAVKTARKSAAASKGKRATKTSKGPRAARTSEAAALDLKQLRKNLERAVETLASRGTTDASSARAAAQSALSKWVQEIDTICESAADDICGPAMVIPLA